MAKRKRNRLTLDFSQFDEQLKRLEEAGGKPLLKKGVSRGLKAAKEVVNTNLVKKLKDNNLPAKGKYNKNKTKAAINKDFVIEWKGDKCRIKIGFDLYKEKGLVSIFLMYGTPKMSPVKGLKNVIYGTTAKKKVKEKVAEALNEVIQETLEG